MADQNYNRIELEKELKTLFGGKIPETIATMISGLNDDQLAQFIRWAAESGYSVQPKLSDPEQLSSSWKRAAVNQFKFILIGLVSGLICIIGGIILIVHN